MISALILGATMGTQAQTNKWFQDLKLSGFAMLQYQAQDKEDDESNAFNLRLARVALEGRAHDDFYWKAQMQINGTTKEDASAIRLVDLFGEWQKYDFLKVKVGQFKRPFTFENPMNPINQGFMNYSLAVRQMSGFSDRTGEHASNGRDIGVQLQGDFLKDASGRNWLHYQIGVFNGQGINVKDADNRKDIIGGLWVMPMKGLRVGVFGWTGSRGGMTWEEQVTVSAIPSGSQTITINKNGSRSKNRYALSAEYAQNDWTLRTEYIHSQGFGSNIALGDKADGYYALCIAPIQKNKLHVKARYDLYRQSKEWGSAKTFYEVGADYLFTKNLQLNVEYALVNDRTAAKHNYNMVDVELDVRF